MKTDYTNSQRHDVVTGVLNVSPPPGQVQGWHKTVKSARKAEH